MRYLPKTPTILPELPVITPLEFEEKGEWPPRPIGQSDVELIPWTEIPGSLTDAETKVLRAAALADASVTAQLGARYAFISADEIEPPKGTAVSSLLTRLTYFSHSNNVMVEVHMLDGAVDEVNVVKGAMPPEGRDEVQMALDIVLADAELAELLLGMQADGIAIYPQEGQAGAGHRVLYMAFSNPGALTTLYFAVVDLTALEILASGPAAGL